MDNVIATDASVKPFVEFCKRAGSIPLLGLHLNGIDFIFQFALVGKDEINLYIIAVLFFIVMKIKAETLLGISPPRAPLEISEFHRI